MHYVFRSGIGVVLHNDTWLLWDGLSTRGGRSESNRAQNCNVLNRLVTCRSNWFPQSEYCKGVREKPQRLLTLGLPMFSVVEAYRRPWIAAGSVIGGHVFGDEHYPLQSSEQNGVQLRPLFWKRNVSSFYFACIFCTFCCNYHLRWDVEFAIIIIINCYLCHVTIFIF